MDYESIAHETIQIRSPWGQEVKLFLYKPTSRSKKDIQIKLLMKSSDIAAKWGSLLFWFTIFSQLVGYHKLDL